MVTRFVTPDLGTSVDHSSGPTSTISASDAAATVHSETAPDTLKIRFRTRVSKIDANAAKPNLELSINRGHGNSELEVNTGHDTAKAENRSVAFTCR